MGLGYFCSGRSREYLAAEIARGEDSGRQYVDQQVDNCGDRLQVMAISSMKVVEVLADAVADGEDQRKENVQDEDKSYE